MITIHHNFDETQFKWLWARYVKAGNLEKHCVNCIPGVYSKKFSGSSNLDLLSQPSLVMDEVPDGLYEAIYFCGVLKKGYLNKNPFLNNYRHNVHFAVRPQKGEHDVWDFENWHVVIEDGVLESIPATCELGNSFFQKPYTSHFYSCRIFRWMVGHFYPEMLRDIKHGYPEIISSSLGNEKMYTMDLIKELISSGKTYVEDFLHDDSSWGYFSNADEKEFKFKYGLVNRVDVGNYISENMGGGCGPILLEVYSDYSSTLIEEDMVRYIELGIEEALDKYFPYQERRCITGWEKE